MIGEVIYNDEDIKMLEDVLYLIETHNECWDNDAIKKLKEFIERMRFK